MAAKKRKKSAKRQIVTGTPPIDTGVLAAEHKGPSLAQKIKGLGKRIDTRLRSAARAKSKKEA